eukprot:CAMPEP_0177710768 /NCGR_PEP_ID=MMETSP0484_2-20121128/11507_1 /TAXON_ID=354590 /ORGANISM="Rhodomonas lens, Strain RHODO" /LENGTH=110 /DNA_ID=CAMNT_0019222463 /DNA_START=53 /DNA_END=383 /DNA_ORIENTATION=-
MSWACAAQCSREATRYNLRQLDAKEVESSENSTRYENEPEDEGGEDGEEPVDAEKQEHSQACASDLRVAGGGCGQSIHGSGPKSCVRVGSFALLLPLLVHFATLNGLIAD